MKKVLVLLAASLLLATPALAAISNTAHDLSSGNTNGSGSDSDQICVFCHTPHGAGAAGTAPLWNRTTINATNVYGDPAGTMNATPTLASVNASDAILCLSCHDGASLSTNLTNPPNALSGAQPNITATIGTAANLDTDLSNDHPIGFDYTVAAADTEIQAQGTVQGIAGMEDALSYGGGNDMWCSSCHDVHGTGNTAFLRISNAGSNLCLTCHIK